jgi:hypothetical protein
VQSIGVGAGTRDFPNHPNIVRVLIGEIDTTSGSTGGNQEACAVPPLPSLLPPVTRPTGKSAVVSTGKAPLLVVGLMESAAAGAVQPSPPPFSSTTNASVEPSALSASGTTPINNALQIKSSNNTSSAVGVEVGKGVADSTPSATAVEEPSTLWEEQELLLLQTNIDDMTAELLANLIDRLIAARAKDAWTENIGMKKGRSSATMVSVLCVAELREKLLTVIFTESTSVGIRISTVERAALRRYNVEVDTEYGPVLAKVRCYHFLRLLSAVRGYNSTPRSIGNSLKRQLSLNNLTIQRTHSYPMFYAHLLLDIYTGYHLF